MSDLRDEDWKALGLGREYRQRLRRQFAAIQEARLREQQGACWRCGATYHTPDNCPQLSGTKPA